MVISQLISSFERSSLPWKIKSPDWNLFLVLESLTFLSYEHLKLCSYKHLTGKTCLFVSSRVGRKGSAHCVVFPTEYVTQRVGFLVPSLSFLTSWPIPRILLCMINISRSSLFHHRLTLWMKTEMRCCCAPSEPSRGISAGQSSSGLSSLLSLS